MRAKSRIARRYAEALGMLAQERGLIDRVERDLENVREFFVANPDVRRLWEDRRVPGERKEALVKAAFGVNLAKETLHFLYLLVRKQRETYLDEIIDAYIAYANRLRGIVEVDITSARELDAELERRLTEGLQKAFGVVVRLRTEVDAEILGGVKAQVGDLLIDGSALGRLIRMERALRAAQLN